jgi:hypothetical protein
VLCNLQIINEMLPALQQLKAQGLLHTRVVPSIDVLSVFHILLCADHQ